MKKYTRRDVLKVGSSYAALGFLSQAFPNISFASRWFEGNKIPDHFFVTVTAINGLDATLGLDPMIMPADCDDKDVFLEYRPEEIQTIGGIKLGPAAEPLVAHAKDISLIHGIMMRRDAGHFAMQDYMFSGRGDGKAGNVALEIAHGFGGGPFGLLISDKTLLSDKPVLITKTRELLNGGNEDALIELLEEKMELEPGGTPLTDAQQALVKAKPMIKSMVATLAQLKQKYQTLGNVHAMAAAFKSGVSWQAHLNIEQPLDTHSDHPKNHLALQKNVWTQVAELFRLFKEVEYNGSSLFDHTTFIVMSEMSRTPALNASNGKDHNPFTNSVLLAGKGIQKNKTTGASFMISRNKHPSGIPHHFAHPWDYKLGKLAEKKEGASFLFPENVIRTVGDIFGNPPNFTPIANTVPIIAGVKA